VSRAKDHPRSFTAEVHILFSWYVDLIGLNLAELTREAILAIAPTAINRRASTVSFVRDGEMRAIIDPGQVPHRQRILEPLAALGESPDSITDVIFSHHHPDHTLKAALFPHARFHDHASIIQDDTFQLHWREADGYEVSPSIRLIETPGHTPEDITTLVGTRDGIVAFTHPWRFASGPADDPLASDVAALHQNRERVLRVATLIVPGHGAPFRPDESTPR
jgi:glyoxylase-like metal-dependent hydrolase (beta-lactamase superfamily II)